MDQVDNNQNMRLSLIELIVLLIVDQTLGSYKLCDSASGSISLGVTMAVAKLYVTT